MKKEIKTILEDVKTLIQSGNKNHSEIMMKLVELIERQQEEIEVLNDQLSIKSAYESTFNMHQLELLAYIYTNGAINEIKLADFYKKDQKYRAAFTVLKDEYVYKGYGDIYNNSPNYHIKPDKEKYVVEALTQAGKI